MIKTYFKTARTDTLQEIDEIKSGSWANVINATQEDLEKVAELAGLDYADLRDGLDQQEIPRVEHHDGVSVLFLRQPSEPTNGLYTNTLTLVLNDRYLITISPTENPILQNMMEKNFNAATTQRPKLLLLILLQVSQSYTRYIKNVRSQVAKYAKALEQADTDDILQLTRNEEILNQYLSALAPMKNVFSILLSRQYVVFHEKDKDLLEDLVININQSLDACTVSLKSIRSLRDSHQIIFTNNLNRTIKLLTALTIVLTLPTIIGSLYGMNVHLPLENHPHAFSIILGISLGLSVLMFALFRKMRWF